MAGALRRLLLKFASRQHLHIVSGIIVERAGALALECACIFVLISVIDSYTGVLISGFGGIGGFLISVVVAFFLFHSS